MHVIGVHQAEKSLLEEEIHMDQVSYEFFLYPFVDFLEKKNHGVLCFISIDGTEGIYFISYLTFSFGNIL